MKATGHIGNAHVWERLLYNLKLFDKKLHVLCFQEIDIKYVNSYNQFMEKRGWSGNSYPFGKDGFCISALEEETRK
eukprot:9376955-Prorocentrum_lima.AAC.1